MVSFLPMEPCRKILRECPKCSLNEMKLMSPNAFRSSMGEVNLGAWICATRLSFCLLLMMPVDFGAVKAETYGIISTNMNMLPKPMISKKVLCYELSTTVDDGCGQGEVTDAECSRFACELRFIGSSLHQLQRHIFPNVGNF